ncbi:MULTISPECIES: hypothetical protein [Synechococcales]|uniref:hypothetical protein n=1 Tax=Synechococcales TaxID=1890424 RepID=UPI000B9848D3|nr:MULTISPECIES: hypothetical protein [Synechococcales]MCP9941304.1 hypothetical protein [Cyanobium sp. ATX 6E8]
MSPSLLPSRVAVVSGIGLLGLAAALLPCSQPAQAQAPAPIQAQSQACPCSCEQPSVGLIGPDGLCQCPCGAVPIPGINAETLSGPPKPPKAGGPAPTWTVEPGFEDGFGGPFWGDWW